LCAQASLGPVICSSAFEAWSVQSYILLVVSLGLEGISSCISGPSSEVVPIPSASIRCMGSSASVHGYRYVVHALWSVC
jgi:hypothetical protein